jgi:AhpD family alkylhydroperoxidase
MTHPHEHDADRRYAAVLHSLASTESSAFAAFNAASVGRTDGAIPPKYRELIALGVALTTQCQFCLASHTATLKKLGASADEVAETVFIASALRAGAAYTHGMVAMRFFDGAAKTADAPVPGSESVTS